MTDQADTPTSGPADSQHLLTDLITVLTHDAELHARLLNRFDDMIDARVQEIKAEFHSRTPTPDLHEDVVSELGAEVQRTRRAKWYTIVVALLVLVVGAVLSYLVVSMAHELDRMEDYMYNMGHSLNDDRLIAQDERKTTGTSYLLTMTDHMQAMREDIGAMRLAITHMDGSMTSMSANTKAMTGSMGTMQVDMGAMSKNMTTMSYIMDLLRQDTAMMRVSVGGMSNDTRSMGAPFRFMSGFMPW